MSASIAKAPPRKYASWPMSSTTIETLAPWYDTTIVWVPKVCLTSPVIVVVSPLPTEVLT